MTRETFIKEVCKHYGIMEKKLYERTRKRKITEPRMLVWTYENRKMKQDYSIIAKNWGFDRKTVYHGLKLVIDLQLDKKINLPL